MHKFVHTCAPTRKVIFVSEAENDRKSVLQRQYLCKLQGTDGFKAGNMKRFIVSDPKYNQSF
jgi:hypothetical protein